MSRKAVYDLSVKCLENEVTDVFDCLNISDEAILHASAAISVAISLKRIADSLQVRSAAATQFLSGEKGQ